MKGYLSCSFISLISIAIFFVLAGKTNAWNVSPCVSLIQSKFTESSFSSFSSSGSSSEMRRMAHGVTDLTKMSSAITTRRRRMVAVSSTTTTQARLFGHYYKSGSHAATRFPTTTTNLHFDGRQSSVVSLASFRGSDRSCRTVLSVGLVGLVGRSGRTGRSAVGGRWAVWSDWSVGGWRSVGLVGRSAVGGRSRAARVRAVLRWLHFYQARLGGVPLRPTPAAAAPHSFRLTANDLIGERRPVLCRETPSAAPLLLVVFFFTSN